MRLGASLWWCKGAERKTIVEVVLEIDSSEKRTQPIYIVTFFLDMYGNCLC